MFYLLMLLLEWLIIPTDWPSGRERERPPSPSPDLTLVFATSAEMRLSGERRWVCCSCFPTITCSHAQPCIHARRWSLSGSLREDADGGIALSAHVSLRPLLWRTAWSGPESGVLYRSHGTLCNMAFIFEAANACWNILRKGGGPELEGEARASTEDGWGTFRRTGQSLD